MKMKTLCIIFILFLNLNLVFAQPPTGALPKESTRALSVVEVPIQAINISPPQKEIEIEIGRSWTEGCKNVCGDGVCQEFVCMASGCPCPETWENCPQDCKTIRPEPPGSPVIALPVEARVKINPTAEKPILINEKPVEFKGIFAFETAVPPAISVEVKEMPPAEEKAPVPLSTNVIISIDKERQRVMIGHENVFAFTRENIKIEEKEIKIETPKRDIEVNVLPALATQVAISKIPQEIQKVELKVAEEKPVYEIEGVKAGKLLWLIPVNLSVQTHVDAQTGETIKIEKPWWSFLVA